jgi:hypothetical protein
MTSSGTRSASFTITDARYVGAKVATDLRLLNNLYGRPVLTDIDAYAEEVALLLRDGYVDTVSYGFRDPDTNEWKLRLRYTATAGGQLLDSKPGSFPTAAAVSSYSFYSYLTYSQKYLDLTPSQQEAVKQTLPVQRVGAEEPSARYGTTTTGNGYARNGVGVARDVYTAA